MEYRQAAAFAEAPGTVVLAQMVTVDHLDLRLKELENPLLRKTGAMIAGSTAITITVLAAIMRRH